MINYYDAIIDADNLTLYFPKENGREVKGLYTAGRVDRNSVPEGVYVYDFRECDNYYLFYALEPNVLVNHGGCFICSEEIDFGENNRLVCDYPEVIDDTTVYSEPDIEYSFS